MNDRERAIVQLKWLVFNFPWQNEHKDEADRMCNAINLYARDAIKVLEAQEPISPKRLVLRWCFVGL